MSKGSVNLQSRGVRTLLTGMLMLVCVGVFFLGGGQAEAANDSVKPLYYEMDSMVVNISPPGQANRYLKIKPVLVVSNPSFYKKLKSHSPVVRSHLLSMYTRETVASLLADDGFDRLREKSLEEVRRVVNGVDGSNVVSDVLFNEYVIQ